MLRASVARPLWAAPKARFRAPFAIAALLLALFLALVAPAPRARAQEIAPPPPEVPPTRLVLRAGELAPLCPGLTELKSSVASRLGADPFAEPAERVLVVGVEGGPGAEDTARVLRARIELFDAELNPLGERVIESDEGCAELLQAAALAASIALAPERVLAPPLEPPPLEPPPLEPAPVETPVAEPAPVEPPVEEPPEAPTDPAPPPRWPFLPPNAVLLGGLGTSWAFFLGPGPSVGPALSAAARDGLWELRAELRGRVGYEDDIHTAHGALTATVLPCLHLPLLEVLGDDPLGVQACASGTAGAVWAAGGWFGVSPYVGAGGQAGLEWVQPSRAAFRLWTQVEVALFRPIYVDLTGGPLLDQAAPANAAIGVTWEIPISP